MDHCPDISLYFSIFKCEVVPCHNNHGRFCLAFRLCDDVCYNWARDTDVRYTTMENNPGCV